MYLLKKLIKMTGLVIVCALLILIVIGSLFLNLSPEFGGKADAKSKERYSLAKNYSEGKFVNQIPTPMDMDFKLVKSLLIDYLKGNPKGRPQKPLPVMKLDSITIVNNHEKLTKITWFGHSAFLLEIAGQNILIDPMLGPSPSPHPMLGGKRFSTTLPIYAEALPAIDAVIFSHDHYDHLDYGSVMKLKDKVAKFYTPLGLGAHLKSWGVAEEKIHELNWGDSISHKDLKFICAPARHFSGRGVFDRDATLWSSWIISSPDQQFFFSGDSGYGPHFKEIGEKYGPFDFAMLECGQYDARWDNIHMMPEQTALAAQDINAKVMMPIHWGAFKLALHNWTDPVEHVTKSAEKLGIPVVTPQIGETILLNGSKNTINNDWWRTIQ